MAVRLHEVDTVVVGRFNPYIISPPWLTKEEIIPEGKAVEAEISVLSRAVAFRFKTGDISWQVDYNRLIISTEQITDTAALAAKVIEKLPHTPLTAIGNNFRYRCNLTQWKGRSPKLDDVGFDQLREFGDVQSIGWKASINKSNDLTVNIEMTLEPTNSLSPMVTVNLNYHRNVRDASNLIAGAKRFRDDQNASAMVIESLFRETVEK